MKLLAVSLEGVNCIIFAFVDLFSECPGLFLKKYIFNILQYIRRGTFYFMQQKLY